MYFVKRLLPLLLITTMLAGLLPLRVISAAKADKDNTAPVVAIISDGFAGLDKTDFVMASGSKCRVYKNTLTSLKKKLAGDGVMLNQMLAYACDYIGVNPMSGGETGTALAQLLRDSGQSVQMLLMRAWNKLIYDEEAMCSAISDAITLDADVIVIAPSDEVALSERMETLLAAADENGTLVICAAGDSGSMGRGSIYDGKYGIHNPSTLCPMESTLEGIASCETALTVGSVENGEYTDVCIGYGEGGFTPFTDTTANYEIVDGQTFTEYFNGIEIPYVPVDGLGTPEDCAAVDLDGKIALIMRGGLSFVDKVNNAAAEGAVGAVIYDNDKSGEKTSNMILEGALLPAIMIPYAKGIDMIAQADRTLHIVHGMTAELVLPNGGQVSSFSSRGPSQSLTVKPDIVMEGGSVNLGVDEDGMPVLGNSTSYAAISAAAAAVELISLYRESGIEYTPASLKSAMMNIASPVPDYSPRAQGAGLIHTDSLTIPTATLMSADGNAAISLGDGLGDRFGFDVRLTNTGASECTYRIGATVTGDDYTEIVPEDGQSGRSKYFTSGTTMKLDGATVNAECDKIKSDSVNINGYAKKCGEVEITLAAGESVTIRLTVGLRNAVTDSYARIFKNGCFIDGYVTAVDESDNKVSIAYGGFTGDYGSLAVFDEVGADKGIYGMTALYSFSGKAALSDIKLLKGVGGRLPAISPDGNNSNDYLGVSFTLNRAVKAMRYTIKNSMGESVCEIYDERLYDSSSGSNAAVVSPYLSTLWNGRADDNVSYVYPDGEYTLTLTAEPIYGEPQSISFRFLVDTVKPEVIDYTISDGKLLINTADTSGIAKIVVYEMGENLSYAEMEYIGSELSDCYTFDISGATEDKLYIDITDGAGNVCTMRIDI